MVGRVVRAGPATPHTAGEIVFCKGARRADARLGWGAHISHAVLPAEQVIPAPVGVDLREAVTTTLAAIAHRGMTIAHPLPHKIIAVLGLGVSANWQPDHTRSTVHVFWRSIAHRSALSWRSIMASARSSPKTILQQPSANDFLLASM